MPKLSQEKIILPSGKEWMRVINVTKVGTFECELPEELADALRATATDKYMPVNRIVGQSLNDLRTKWDDVMKKASLQKAKKQKVICYSINMDGKIERDGKTVRLIHLGLYQRSSLLGLSISVAVFEETTVIEGARDGRAARRRSRMKMDPRAAHYSYRRLDSSIPESACFSEYHGRYPSESSGHYWSEQLPWTQEREDWFAGLVLAMEELMIGLAKAVGSEPKTLADTISKRKALPAAVIP